MLRIQNVLALAAVLFVAERASAYVDLAPTLARIVRESQTIVVAEVVSFSPEKGAIALKRCAISRDRPATM